ncbi:MAG: hypothetical protein HY841_14875 [Bacteroidetes bacterium]|nr:hypothetical protein [Bacteroidota bacterium]
MRPQFTAGFLLLFSLPLLSFSQINGLNALKQVTNALTTQDTTSQKKKSTGTQSNLAVSDEGTPNKPKDNKKVIIENPIDKAKENLIEKTAPSSGSTGSSTGNLAVSDEGVGGKDKRKTNREATGTATTPEQPKQETVTPAPK